MRLLRHTLLCIVAGLAAPLLCAFTLTAVADTADSSTINGSLEWPNAANKAYFREAVVYQIRANRDLDTLLRLDKFARLANAGASEAEITEELNAVSRRLGGFSTEVRNRTGYDEAIKLGFAAAGFLRGRSALGIAAGYGLAEAMLQLYDEVAGEKKQARATRRQAAELGRRRIELEVLDHALEAYGNRPELDFSQHFPRMGIRPGDSKGVIAARVPDFQQFKAVLNIESRVERNARLIDLAKIQINDVGKELSAKLEEANKNIQAVDGKLTAYMAYQFEAATSRERQEIHRVKVEGIRSAAYLVTTLVGFADPEAGKHMAAVTDTFFQAYDAIEAFTAATRLADGLTGLASVALTGNLVSAGLSLIEAFIGGPKPEEIILEEIGKLQKQVEALHKDMHDRFDRVDRQLNEIHETLISGLNALYRYIETGNRDIRTRLVGIQRTLASHEKRLSYVSNLMIDLTDVLLERLDADVLACLNRRTTFEDDPLDRDEYIKCLEEIQASAATLEGMQLESPPTPREIASMLWKRPDRTVNQALQVFRGRSASKDLLPTKIVGPDAWFDAADIHDRFMAEWPEYSDALTENNSYSETMKRYRNDLIQYIEAVREDYFRFYQREPSAIGSIFEEVRSLIADMEAMIEHNIRETLGDVAEFHENMYLASPSLIEEKWSDSFSVLPLRKCPHVRTEDSFQELPAEILDEVEVEIKNRIEDLHPKLTRMINMGMVRISVCAVQDHYYDGSNTSERLEEPREYFGKRYWNVWRKVYRAMVSIDINFQLLCEETHRDILMSFADYGTNREILTVYNNRPIMIVEEFANVAKLYEELYDEAFLQLVQKIVDYRYFRFDCSSELKARRGEKREEISRVLRRELVEDGRFEELDSRIMLMTAFLASWLRVTLHDATPRSDLIQSIAAGGTGFPSPKAVLDEMWVKEFKREHAWTLPNRLRDQVDDFENTLRSPYFAQLMNTEYGNAKLTDTAYLGID